MRVACCGVDFVPPSQPNKAPPGDVFKVVEVGGEEEHGEDEYEDAGWEENAVSGGFTSEAGTRWRRKEGRERGVLAIGEDVDAKEVDEEGG